MKDVEARFDTSNWELDRPLPKETEQKNVGLMKKELVEKKNGRVYPFETKHI